MPTTRTPRKSAKPRYTCSYDKCPHGEDGKPKQFPGRSKSHSNKYCCHPCYWADKTGKKMAPSARRPRHVTMKHCQNPACGKEFIAKRLTSKYCSVPCAAQMRGDKLRNRPRARYNPSKPILLAG